MSIKNGRDSLKSDFQFAEVGRGGGEEYIISIHIVGSEYRRTEGQSGKSRAALEVAEEDGVEHGGEDLVKFRVNVVSASVRSLVNSDAKEIGDQATKSRVVNSIQDARKEVIKDSHTRRVSGKGSSAVMYLSKEVEREEATKEKVMVKSGG
jgi:hypothetical protein